MARKALRAELCEISAAIKEEYRAGSEAKASDMPALQALLDRDKVGQIFLIICEEMPYEDPLWCSLHTRTELFAGKKIPAGVFHKAGRLNVLRKEMRNYELIRDNGWL